MEIVLTSFGLSHKDISERPAWDLFYRMPPVSMSAVREFFFPDYAVLLLCDKIVLDSRTYEQLSEGPHLSYRRVADTIRLLHTEGFVRLEDFESIVREHSVLLEEMLKRDLRRLDDWVNPLRESLTTWQDFAQKAQHILLGEHRTLDDTDDERRLQEISAQQIATRLAAIQLVGDWKEVHLPLEKLPKFAPSLLRHGDLSSTHLPYPPARNDLLQEALKSSRKRKRSKFRAVLRECLSEYLSCVNANLVISNVLGLGIHDWYDFLPFYREKMLVVGREATPEQQRISKMNQLFEISFPEFRLWDPRSLVKALKDKRIGDLRQLVDEAVEGKVEFDAEFARRVLAEVCKQERDLRRFRTIVSYLTMPVDFIPWVGTFIQKGAEEGIVHLKEKKLKEKYRWFYLISEIGGQVEPSVGSA